MQFAFVGVEGLSTSWWMRLKDEGHSVKVWIEPKLYKHVGDGMVEKAKSFGELLAWARKAPTIFVFDGSGMGDKADLVRKAGFPVFGGGAWMDKLEKKRAYGERLASVCGIKVPEHFEFPNLKAAVQFLQGAKDDEKFVFKTDEYLEASTTYADAKNRDELVEYIENIAERFGDNVKCLLQRRVEGVAISTAFWFDGKKILTPIEGTIEHKKAWNEDIGPHTGCSLNIVWFYEDSTPKIFSALHLSEIEKLFVKEGAPAGIYDINAVIADGSDDLHKASTPYFLEWTPRFGYDSEMTSQLALTMPMGEFLQQFLAGTLDKAPFDTQVGYMAVRVTVPPYPTEKLDERELESGYALGVPIRGVNTLWREPFVVMGVMLSKDGKLVCGDPGGIIGIAATSGTYLNGMNEEILTYIKEELGIPNPQYRTDSAEVLLEDISKLRKLGFGPNRNIS